MKLCPRLLPLMLPLLLLSPILSATPRGDVGGDDDSRLRRSLRALVARADSGDAKALFDLASLHERGYDTIPVDSARALELCILSAEKGYAPAQNYLGFKYYRGEGIGKDIGKGLYWMEKAAMQGDPKGANNLGWMLSEGEGVIRDYVKAAFWLRRAADAGLPAGQAQLADLLRMGRGVAADTIAADSLYTLAIRGGLRDAEAKLLSMQHERWHRLQADSALRLGIDHYIHRAPTIGVTLFEQVAAGSPTPTDSAARAVRAHALALLGDAYTRSVGVEYDYDKGIEYFIEAAMLGNPSAQFIIGEMLEIFPDALTGNKELRSDPGWWLSRAAESGVTDAAISNRRLLTPE